MNPSSHPENLKILFGPYGSVLPSLGLNSDVQKICRSGQQDWYSLAIEMIARGYHDAGATMPTVNAFFLRTALKEGFTELFKNMLSLNLQALLKALKLKTKEKLTICLGPAGDCYSPQEAPDEKAAYEFHKYQYSLCLEVMNRFGLSTKDVLFLHETIGTQREAVGLSLAAHSLSIPLIVSFVVTRKGYLLSGELIEPTIEKIDSLTHHFVQGFSLNCCSPYAFDAVVKTFRNPKQIKRIIGFYPNSYDSDPCFYESGATLFEPKKEETIKLILEKGHSNHLGFVGGCCGFNYHDVKLLCQLKGCSL